MPTDSIRLDRARREAAEAVRRACVAPLDSIRLREEIVARLETVLPGDALALVTCDPVVGIVSHAVTWGYDEASLNAYNTWVYPEDTALRLIDNARAGIAVWDGDSPIEREYLRTYGYSEKLNLVFADQSGFWGGGCWSRRLGAARFDDDDRALLAHLAPAITCGLRRAAVMEAARVAEVDDATAGSTLPGVAVYDSNLRLVLRDERTVAYLEDLSDAPAGAHFRVELPPMIGAALAQLRWSLRSPERLVATEHLDGFRGRGRSGRWYRVHASMVEAAQPDQAGQTVVVISPLNAAERATLLFRLYGLSPREREVVVRTARGESSKQIAAALGLSMHTVQAHIDNACTKVGARGRKELVARIFFDAMAARVAS